MLKKLCLIAALVMLSSCNGNTTSTTSFFKIIEKGHSLQQKEYWVIGYDENNFTEEDAFKIIVEDANVWHLIELNKQYFTTYAKKSDQPWRLVTIEHMIQP